MKKINFYKSDWKYLNHLKRYKEYVEKNGLPCQECGSTGEYINDTIDFGDDSSGPICFNIYGTCGWCEGTGKITRRNRGIWLNYRKMLKKEKLMLL